MQNEGHDIRYIMIMHNLTAYKKISFVVGRHNIKMKHVDSTV